MLVKPEPRCFALSEETTRLIERQIQPDMGPGLAWFYATAFLASLGAAGNGADDSGWRTLFTLIAIISGIGLLMFIGQKVLRLLRGRKVSDEDWANHARYRLASNQFQAHEVEIERSKREQSRLKHEEMRRRVSWWQSLAGDRFEREVAALLIRHGYVVRQTGGPGDEGVDLVIQKSREKILVQCKALNRDVGPGAIRDLYGALMHHHADEAWLITSRGFSSRARRFATGKSISLLTIENLLTRADTLL